MPDHRLLLRVLARLLRFAVTLAAVIAAVMLTAALWRLYMLTPWTRDGRVQAQVADIAPEVAGTIATVPVIDNQMVRKGDVLFTIDPQRYRLAIDQAQSQLDAAAQQQQLRASDVRRRRGLSGIVSAEEQERVANTAAVADATLAGAQAALAVARLNLEKTTVVAPANGYVTHLRLRPGDYAAAGQARVAVIDSDSFWVTGYFEETKLARIHVGDVARIKLMGFDPVVTGQVESIGRGIGDANDAVNASGLPTVNPIFTWVRLAQRVPIRIAIRDVPAGVELVSGLTASVSLGEAARPAATGRGRLLDWLKENL